MFYCINTHSEIFCEVHSFGSKLFSSYNVLFAWLVEMIGTQNWADVDDGINF